MFNLPKGRVTQILEGPFKVWVMDGEKGWFVQLDGEKDRLVDCLKRDPRSLSSRKCHTETTQVPVLRG